MIRWSFFRTWTQRMNSRCMLMWRWSGENCLMMATLPLYMGDGGSFERTFCCYGNDVDCTRCGAYSVFNTAYHRVVKGEQDYHHRTRHLGHTAQSAPPG